MVSGFDDGFRFSFHCDPLEGQLKGAFQIRLLKRLGNESVGLCSERLLESRVIRIGSQKNHRHLKFFQNDPGRFYAIHFAGQDNVHQDDIRPIVFNSIERILSPRIYPYDFIPEFGELHRNICGNDHIVLYHQNFRGNIFSHISILLSHRFLLLWKLNNGGCTCLGRFL